MQWLAPLFARRRIDDDLAEEIRQHIEEKTAALVAEGKSPEEARFAAKREFGNITGIVESGREVWMWPRLESVLSDLRFAIRRLRKSPGFALTATVTLALGIGANVVVFSVVNGFILRPLDVPHPENLYEIDRTGGAFASQAYRDYVDYRDRDSSFSGMVALEYMRVGFTAGKSATRSWGYAVSGNYFDVLEVQPAVGRFFHSSDEHGPGSAPDIVLTHDFWRTYFNSDPGVVGQTVRLNQHPFTVVGVAPEGFHGTDASFVADYWMPLMNAAQVTGFDDLCCRDHPAFTLLGRLNSGVTPQQATSSLNVLCARMAKEDPKDEGLKVVIRRPGPAGDPNDPTSNALLGIMLLAVLVLLAACANLASIFAARAADRSVELAVRLAIGSSRWMVLRQLLSEALVVSTAGGLVGLFFARLLLERLSQWQPFPDFPTHFLVAPDARVYAVALILSIGSGVFFGLLPARQVWRTDVVQTIKGGHEQTASFRRLALRDVLLLVQIVVCTLLVTASLVAVRGMIRSLQVPLGFNPAGTTLAEADLGMAGYSPERALPVQKRILEAAASIPGVTATIADSVPFRIRMQWFVYRWGTTEFLPAHMAFPATTFLITPGYLHVAGTRLLYGRDFTWHDTDGSPRVAIVNQSFARKLYGSRSPIGQRFALWATAKYEVVGVVEGGKYMSRGEDEEPAMFIPLAQGVGEVKSNYAVVLVRSSLPRDQIARALERRLSSVEPGVPFTLASWGDTVDRAMTGARAATMVLAVMGLMAAMLAVTGVFGMASYSVSKRMKEQGIRIALGARPAQVMRSALRRPLTLLVGGVVFGLFLGSLTSRVLAHLVSFATPRDPLVLAAVAIAMTLLGLVGTWGPARRALSIDPAKLLRE